MNENENENGAGVNMNQNGVSSSRNEGGEVIDHVGPVFESNEAARAVIAAIQEMNPEAEIQDRGSYLRVLAPGSCRVTRQAIENSLGRPFRLPADLEALMPAFKGRLTMTEDEVVWAFRGAA